VRPLGEHGDHRRLGLRPAEPFGDRHRLHDGLVPLRFVGGTDEPPVQTARLQGLRQKRIVEPLIVDEKAPAPLV